MKKFLLLTIVAALAATNSANAAFAQRSGRILTSSQVGGRAASASSPFAASRAARGMSTTASTPIIPAFAAGNQAAQQAGSRVLEASAESLPSESLASTFTDSRIASAASRAGSQTLQQAGSRVLEAGAPATQEAIAGGGSFVSGLGRSLPSGPTASRLDQLGQEALAQITPDLSSPDIQSLAGAAAGYQAGSHLADVDYLRSAQYDYAPASSAPSYFQQLRSWWGGSATPAVAVEEGAPAVSGISSYLPTRESLSERWGKIQTGVKGGLTGLQTSAVETFKPISEAYQTEGLGAACAAAGGQFTSSLREHKGIALGLGTAAVIGSSIYAWRWYNQLEKRLLRAVQNGDYLQTDALFAELVDKLNAAQGKPDYAVQAEATRKIFVDADTLAFKRKDASSMIQHVQKYDKIRELISDATSRINDAELKAQIKEAVEKPIVALPPVEDLLANLGQQQPAAE